MSERDAAARRPAWDGVIEIPVRDRLAKPREAGWTMVIDKGLGLNVVDDLMQVAAPAIDVLKLTFGTSAFFSHDVLKEKVRTVTAHGVYCMPGGTFQEVAIWQGALDRYLDRARELGFNAIEVSDGTIEMDARTRADAISKAVKAGFRVLSEVGKKDPADAQPMSALAEVVNADLDGGAFMVIMEAPPSGCIDHRRALILAWRSRVLLADLVSTRNRGFHRLRNGIGSRSRVHLDRAVRDLDRVEAQLARAVQVAVERALPDRDLLERPARHAVAAPPGDCPHLLLEDIVAEERLCPEGELQHVDGRRRHLHQVVDHVQPQALVDHHRPAGLAGLGEAVAHRDLDDAVPRRAPRGNVALTHPEDPPCSSGRRTACSGRS